MIIEGYRKIAFCGNGLKGRDRSAMGFNPSLVACKKHPKKHT